MILKIIEINNTEVKKHFALAAFFNKHYIDKIIYIIKYYDKNIHKIH